LASTARASALASVRLWCSSSVRRRASRLHVRAEDRDLLVHALGADQREVGLAHERVLGAQLERLGDAGGHRERHAVPPDCVAARRRWANSIAP
jgi:hypothetical protein